jgi:hypothetical protein
MLPAEREGGCGRGRSFGGGAKLFAACALAVLAAVSLLGRSSPTPSRASAPVELEDSAWMNAVPAFGSAMSADDLQRQIHWLRKHNAAHPGSKVHKLDITLPDGAALQPVNTAALDRLQVSVRRSPLAAAFPPGRGRLSPRPGTASAAPWWTDGEAHD